MISATQFALCPDVHRDDNAGLLNSFNKVKRLCRVIICVDTEIFQVDVDLSKTEHAVTTEPALWNSDNEMMLSVLLIPYLFRGSVMVYCVGVRVCFGVVVVAGRQA